MKHVLVIVLCAARVAIAGDAAPVKGGPPTCTNIEQIVASALSANFETGRAARREIERLEADALVLVPALIEKLAVCETSDWETNESPAVIALDKIGDLAVESLLEVVANRDHPGRAAAIRALGMIRHEHAFRRLTTALRDDDPEVRRSAAWALAEIGPDFAASDLVEALRDEDADTRRLAALALGKTRATGATQALIDALRDNIPAVRASAAYALGKLGAIEAIEPLSALLHDPDPSVPESATDAISRIRKQND